MKGALSILKSSLLEQTETREKLEGTGENTVLPDELSFICPLGNINQEKAKN